MHIKTMFNTLEWRSLSNRIFAPITP